MLGVVFGDVQQNLLKSDIGMIEVAEERKYSIYEIDRMRQLVDLMLMLGGRGCANQTELQLRTYMMAGITIDELKDEITSRKQKIKPNWLHPT